jgi:hypothetical protein
MTTLSELQAWFAEQLVRPRALTKDPDVVAAAARYVLPSSALSAVDRVEIYREQFWLRHTASLLEDFPGVAGILGQADWERLSESYLTQYPCRSFNLRDLGERFAEHVARQDWLAHQSLCHDMARLEWNDVELFDAAEPPALDGAKLAGLSEQQWQEATFSFTPALRLLQVDYPVVELRRTLLHRNLCKESATAVPIPDPDPHQLLLCRTKDRALHHERLPAAAFALLQHLLQGETLAAACGQVVHAEPKNATLLESEVGNWFARWGQLQLISDVHA